MEKPPRRPPEATQRAKDEAAARRERLATALRDNLRKRKQQMRERSAGESGRKGSLSPEREE